MKRTIACWMVAVMLLVSLMGCAGKEAASDDSQGSPVTSAEERETEATEAAEATEVTEATEATKVSSDSFAAFFRLSFNPSFNLLKLTAAMKRMATSIPRSTLHVPLFAASVLLKLSSR